MQNLLCNLGYPAIKNAAPPSESFGSFARTAHESNWTDLGGWHQCHCAITVGYKSKIFGKIDSLRYFDTTRRIDCAILCGDVGA